MNTFLLSRLIVVIIKLQSHHQTLTVLLPNPNTKRSQHNMLMKHAVILDRWPLIVSMLYYSIGFFVDWLCESFRKAPEGMSWAQQKPATPPMQQWPRRPLGSSACLAITVCQPFESHCEECDCCRASPCGWSEGSKVSNPAERRWLNAALISLSDPDPSAGHQENSIREKILYREKTCLH